MKIKEIEGEIYLCEWKKVGKQFQISVPVRSEWKVAAKTFAEAEAVLLERIMDDTGDMQPCLEYKPAPPKGAIAARFEGPGIVAVCGANDADDFVGERDTLFTGGVCPLCARGIGERTKAPLTLAQFPRQSDGAFVRIKPRGVWGHMSIYIFSGEFVAALNTKERRSFEWLPVVSVKKSKQEFFEPLALPIGNQVLPGGLFAEKDRLSDDGFVCGKCGCRELAGLPQGGGGIFTFISEPDLPKPLPTCFLVGAPGNLTFCLTKKRWQSLAGKPGTKRLMSRQVGVVREEAVRRKVKLAALK